jgi:hypothetical protein
MKRSALSSTPTCQRGPIDGDLRRRKRAALARRAAVPAVVDDGRIRNSNAAGSLGREPFRRARRFRNARAARFFPRAKRFIRHGSTQRNPLSQKGLAAGPPDMLFRTIAILPAKVSVAPARNRADTYTSRRGATRECSRVAAEYEHCRPSPFDGASSTDTPPPCPTVLCQSLFVVCNLALVDEAITRPAGGSSPTIERDLPSGSCG